jgi:hypothetical protein
MEVCCLKKVARAVQLLILYSVWLQDFSLAVQGEERCCEVVIVDGGQGLVYLQFKYSMLLSQFHLSPRVTVRFWSKLFFPSSMPSTSMDRDRHRRSFTNIV